MPDRDGPDISHHNPVANWDAIPNYPLFVAKATEGSGFRSPTFNENWTQMRRKGFRYRGAYHWLRSDVTPASQLANFKRAIDAHGGLRRGEFVMIDWETTPNVRNLYWSEAREFIWRCEAEWPGRVAVYSSDWVPGFAAFRLEYPDYPLFYANYSLSGLAAGGAAETKKYGADVWQWTSSFDGRPGIADPTIDMNDILDWAVMDRITDQVVVPDPTPVPVPPEQPLPVPTPPPVPSPPAPPAPAPTEYDMKFEPEHRIYDSRQVGPATTLFAVPTGYASKLGVHVAITVIPQGTAGWLQVSTGTSFGHFGPSQVVSVIRPFPVNTDGTISIGATTPVHIVVDVIGSYGA